MFQQNQFSLTPLLHPPLMSQIAVLPLIPLSDADLFLWDNK